ncbi:hypothetical protein GQ53DRAFT_351974 [Thozetella sp. PMI_491]|nr:hypothetical protein GQ53DRAFT_351974 [Thozetella sp. PMI_491]
MEKQNKLADLKLVSKHFPVSNYSYPRNEWSHQQQQQQRSQRQGSTGSYSDRGDHGSYRESRGSNSSVPSMVTDHGSDDGLAEDELQYHVTGAEIWDSFWGAKEKEKEKQIHFKMPRYPVVVKPPTNVHNPAPRVQDQGSRRPSAASLIEDEAASTGSEWPLPDQRAQRPRTPKSPPKASYSLFPPPAPKPPAHLTARTPSRPGTPGAGAQVPQSMLAANTKRPAAGRPKRPAPLNLSAACTSHLAPGTMQPTPPTSVPSSPLLSVPSPRLDRQEDNEGLWQSRRRHPSEGSPRKVSDSMRPTTSHGGFYMMAHANKSESHLPSTLHRSREAGLLSPGPHSAPLPYSPPLPVPRRRSSRAKTSRSSQIEAVPPVPPLPLPLMREASPPRISFWLDSDSEADSADEESRSLARRILGSFSVHKPEREAKESKGHKRSVSDGRGGGKGAPLRRPRADTTGEAMIERPVGLVPRSDSRGEERERAERPQARRQGSDVLGRMLGRRSR